ncbi:AAA family ATPase [Antribacter gilvus]|uniref:AAA family ATPase n=1 Tax=Antribacter gilvus TaxID=2304675 RepID=UPI000F7B86AB|nr:AAA family ATPase [Antribacter gilvus]
MLVETAAEARPVVVGPDGSPGTPLFVLVGGVPGAGKSTLLARIAGEGGGATVVDPDVQRRWFAAVLPSWVPYRSYRYVVHTVHALRTLWQVLRGPARERRVLMVHDPATRPRRREVLARLARARGWRPVLVVIDVPMEAALAGQLERGRVVGSRSFAGHWERWSAQRSGLAGAAVGQGSAGAWAGVHVVGRASALSQVRVLLGG